MKLLRFDGLSREANAVASAQTYARVVPMLARGMILKPLLRSSMGTLLIGRGARVKNPQFLSHAGRLVIEDFAEVQGLSVNGINFGADVSVGRGTQIRPSSYYGGAAGVGLQVGDRTSFGTGCFIGCSGDIRIGNDVMLGPGVKLFSENHVFEDMTTTIKAQGVKREFLTIGDDVWIGSGVTVTAGVSIGSGSVIAAGSVVTRDLPRNSVAAGVPARVLRTR
ncbi:acyltransferase [Paenarthrobacter nicotinovorans]|uniref:acyltransferase n=1 Tax=Paenarthrobacter nicotinovorans TaxID=29320 RepID=UPI003748A5D2